MARPTFFTYMCITHVRAENTRLCLFEESVRAGLEAGGRGTGRAGRESLAQQFRRTWANAPRRSAPAVADSNGGGDGDGGGEAAAVAEEEEVVDDATLRSRVTSLINGVPPPPLPPLSPRG